MFQYECVHVDIFVVSCWHPSILHGFVHDSIYRLYMHFLNLYSRCC
jgi:hypothetical protein